MATCNNPGSVLVFGHQMPSELNKLRNYQSEIESGLVSVSVSVRVEEGGPMVTKNCQIQRALAENFKAAIADAYAMNPNLVFIWGGSYCFRAMNNSSANPPASIHSLGCAFDVNVAYNPYRRDNLTDSNTRMRTTNHPLVKAFTSRGWVWGGSWSTPDYMHFEFSSGWGIDGVENTGQYTSPVPDTNANMTSSNTYDTYRYSSGGGTSTQKTFYSTSMTQSGPNTVYGMTTYGTRDDVLKQTQFRQSQFEALRNKMENETPGMGRDIVESPELYDPSILKTTQYSKEERY